MPRYSRRSFVRASGLAASVAAFGMGSRAGAQDGALAAVRIVTGFPVGGTSDTLCHLIAEGIAGTAYSRTAQVDNQSGSGGQRALQAMQCAPSDGSVLLETPAAVLILYPNVPKKLGYTEPATVTAVTLPACWSSPSRPAPRCRRM